MLKYTNVPIIGACQVLSISCLCENVHLTCSVVEVVLSKLEGWFQLAGQGIGREGGWVEGEREVGWRERGR